MDLLYVFLYNVAIALFIGLFLAPPIIFIIRAITNVARAVKSVKKSENVKHSTSHYFLNFIIDVLLLVIILMRLCYDYKNSNYKFYEPYVMKG